MIGGLEMEITGGLQLFSIVYFSCENLYAEILLTANCEIYKEQPINEHENGDTKLCKRD